VIRQRGCRGISEKNIALQRPRLVARELLAIVKCDGLDEIIGNTLERANSGAIKRGRALFAMTFATSNLLVLSTNVAI
jgi:hypothetical protein